MEREDGGFVAHLVTAQAVTGRRKALLYAAAYRQHSVSFLKSLS